MPYQLWRSMFRNHDEIDFARHLSCFWTGEMKAFFFGWVIKYINLFSDNWSMNDIFTLLRWTSNVHSFPRSFASRPDIFSFFLTILNRWQNVFILIKLFPWPFVLSDTSPRLTNCPKSELWWDNLRTVRKQSNSITKKKATEVVSPFCDSAPIFNQKQTNKQRPWRWGSQQGALVTN